jgi:hypothetical protein
VHEATGEQASGTSVRELSLSLSLSLPPTTSQWTQRYCEHLPASTVNDYIEQLIMMNDGNGVTGASSTGPSAGYTFMFLFLFTGSLVWLTDNKMEYIYIYIYMS